jgi:hypothetical protein
MMMETVIRAIVGVGLAFGLLAQTSGPAGVIRGTVVDALGRPVANAEVGALPTEPGHHLLRFIKADSGGGFTLEGLDWGEYLVHARKEADGYPDTNSSIFGGSSPRVTLSAQSPIASAIVKFGPKAASTTPAFADAETGDEVDPSVRIWMWDDAHSYRTATRKPNSEILIPSGQRIGLEFGDGAYDTWRYPDGSAIGQPLVMGPGEKRSLGVALRRSAAMRGLDSRLLEQGASEAAIVDLVSEMYAAAPSDIRAGREIAEVVSQRQSITLAQAVLARYVPAALVTACLDSPVSDIRQAALKSLFGRGNMILRLAPKLRGSAASPNEEPRSQRLAHELLDTIR